MFYSYIQAPLGTCFSSKLKKIISNNQAMGDQVTIIKCINKILPLKWKNIYIHNTNTQKFSLLHLIINK